MMNPKTLEHGNLPLKLPAGGCVLTIGVFDAVHRGHQAIFSHARQIAQRHGVPLVVLAFDPHPMTVLKPEAAPPRLATSEEKTQLIRNAGVHDVRLIQPREELFALSPQAFIAQLVQQYHPVAIVEGENFRFGHQRRGDGQTLMELGEQHGFEVHMLASFEVMLCDQLVMPASSTLVRWLVGMGRVADAARCLGRPYQLTEPVVGGEQRGRTIGVPTANLNISRHPDKLVPADGVYAGLAVLEDGSEHAAAISVGTKPTFGVQQLTVEAHLLDFSGDLYDSQVSIRFCRSIRDQQPFPSIEALRQQLARDIEQTRLWHRQGVLSEIHLPVLA